MSISPSNSNSLREVFSHLPSGVVAIAAVINGKRAGITVSTFIPVSLEPPLAAFCIQCTSTTWPVLRAAPRLGISVLAESHNHVARALSARSEDRFASIGTTTTDTGAVFIEQASACIEASIESQTSAGDHFLVIVDIHGLQLRPEIAPIVFHRSQFRKLVV